MNPAYKEMAKSFSETMLDWIKKGMPMASEEEARKRAEICGQCEFYDNGRCEKCGCFIQAKIRLDVSICPEKRW